ncbi:MAG TPA: hypothetical protein VFS86_04045, partial [Rhodanobacteraceae bacterium]|nr:hypothetical protein [Rhodanobacteraceae bacterium]
GFAASKWLHSMARQSAGHFFQRRRKRADCHPADRRSPISGSLLVRFVHNDNYVTEKGVRLWLRSGSGLI